MKKTMLSIVVIAMLTISVVSAYTLFDSAAVGSNGVPDSSKAYIGVGSWANGTNNDGVFNESDKFSLYLSPEVLFGHNISIEDIESIEYHTYKEEAQGGLNFYLNIYTFPDGVDDDASWYGHRLTLEPLYSHNFTDVLNEWNTWSTEEGVNQLTVFDSNHAPFGWYYPPTWQDILTSEINWSEWHASGDSTSIDYASEVVKYIVIDTGSAWAEDFSGNVDALTINLLNNESVTVDLEALADSDEDGVYDHNDFCEDTTADEDVPERTLKPNRWIWDGVEWVTEAPNGKNRQNWEEKHKDFTINETRGCNCEQIIDTFVEYTDEEYKGHYKFGCSQSLLEDFRDGTWVKVDEFNVDASDVTGMDSTVLKDGLMYRFDASGYWNNTNSGVLADAEYTSTDNWLNFSDGTDTADQLDLQIDETFVDWGVFDSGHMYDYEMTGANSSVNFRVFEGNTSSNVADGNYSDNKGMLTVEVFIHVP